MINLINIDPEILSKKVRADVLRMLHMTKASHVGSCFSVADILAVLYARVLRMNPSQPKMNDRDRVIISKGHAAAVVYAALAHCGYFPIEWLYKYCNNGGLLAGHVSDQVPGVEISSGSLGHGLSVGVGMALAAKIDKKSWNTYVVMSDGECDEGSIWEAALLAGHHRLANLMVLIDFNKIQSFGRVEDVLSLEPFGDKWRAFGWNVVEVNGHDHGQLEATIKNCIADFERPSVIICHTIKGKGVSFMEDKIEWHYKSPNDEQLLIALSELGFSK